MPAIPSATSPTERPPGPLAVSIEGLVVERGGRRILDGISLRLAAGHMLELRGPNGAGKTTLLRVIAGYLAPVAGVIRLETMPGQSDAERSVGEVAHFIGHLNGIKASMSVIENLAFWAAYLDAGADQAERATRVEDALHNLRLTALEHLPVAYLSAGQKRRTCLARLLVAPRPLWLLDEPTSSLDAASSGLFAELLKAHLAAGGMVIAATHLPLGVERAETLRLERTLSPANAVSGGAGSP